MNNYNRAINKTKKKPQTNSSHSWRPGMKTSGLAGIRVLLRVRKVTATRKLEADHSLTVKATKPKIQWNIQRDLDKRGNKRSYMVLYVWQTAFHRKLQESV